MAKGEEYTKAEQQWIAETKDRLAQRRGEKPATKAGQLRALWSEIRAAKAEGQSLATIRQWLEEEAGIILTVQSLGSYLTRIRVKNELPKPHRLRRQRKSIRKRRFRARERRTRLTPIKPVGSSTLRDLRTKANSSEFGLIEKFTVPHPLRHFLYKVTVRRTQIRWTPLRNFSEENQDRI